MPSKPKRKVVKEHDLLLAYNAGREFEREWIFNAKKGLTVHIPKINGDVIVWRVIRIDRWANPISKGKK